MENIPSFAEASKGGNLQQDISNLAPLATTYHGAQTGVSIGQVKNSVPQGNLAKFFNFGSAVASESSHLLGAAGNWLVKQTSSLITAPPKFGTALGNMGLDVYNSHAINKQQVELSQRLDTITSDYKSGRLTLSGYKQALKEYNQDANNLISSENANITHLAQDGQAGAQSGINTAAALATILSSGTTAALSGALKTTTAYLATTPALDAGEGIIGKLAANKALFDSLDPAVQKAVQESVTNTLSTASENLTSKEIARTMAVNLTLKYPLNYAALSGTGQQVYDELQQGKYGPAAITMAFNAALLLSGGPIGWALKRGGQILSTGKTGLLGNTSFLDNLSQLIGDRNPSGLYSAIKDSPELAKNFSALEATNLAAVNGNSTEAVYRVVNGLRNSGWGDVPSMSHEDFAKQINDWANAQRMVTEDAVSRGLDNAENYVVGRWSINDANTTALKVAQGPKEDWLGNWESLKQNNPNAAWANSGNLDKQITSLIDKSTTTGELERSIRGVDAGVAVSGVSSKISSQLAKMGYIVIQPRNLEAPFKEGSQISSKFATDSKFFLRTTSPLPVLGSVGNLLTKAGLSPESAQKQMYETYKANFARNLHETGFTAGRIGETPEQAADDVSKKLADYSRTLPKNLKNPPVTDYRQLTITDLQKALGISREEARKVSSSLMDSMLQVPMAVRGLGDRLLDASYKYVPGQLTGRYARIQGALRFAWNPFFKMKLSYKAEFLSQFESGGKFPTVAGTNFMLRTVFPEKYNQLDKISHTLEREGVFGAGYTDEGAQNSQIGKELGHVLLKGQKRSVSGMVSVMADKTGMSVEDFVKNFPDQTRDTVRMVLQYDPRSSLLNSPLVRTINFAFFPFRFNLKVATIIGRSLARTDALTQFGVVKGLMMGSQFLKSAEGQAWYSQNSDVIGLFKYFTPLATLSEIGQALGQKPHSVSQYGALGGLPFGWIPALLNAEGMIDTNQAYVNPKTGVIAQDYVPVGMRGRANAAIQDLIGQLFTYPGATVGLPSKTSLDVQVAAGLVPGSSKDFKKVTPQITSNQANFQQVVQASAGVNKVKNASIVNTPKQETTIPAQSTPLTTPKVKPSSTRAPKKKKADFTPALLPGQTQLGQLP